MDKQRLLPILLCGLLLSGLLVSCAPSEEGGTPVLFFYMEICPSCEEYKLAEEIARSIAALDEKEQWRGGSYNVADQKNGEILRRTLAERELPDISRSLPVLIVGEEYLNGYEAIKEKVEALQSP